VPCPLDPKHTVAASRLEEHVKVCNARKLQDRIEHQPYYRLNYNSGDYKVRKLVPGFPPSLPLCAISLLSFHSRDEASPKQRDIPRDWCTVPPHDPSVRLEQDSIPASEAESRTDLNNLIPKVRSSLSKG
jgi:hypothetical protein